MMETKSKVKNVHGCISREGTPSGPGKVSRLREESTYGRLKMLCSYVAENMTKYPLTRDVRLWEVKNVVFVCS